MKQETKWLMNYLDERELIPEMDRCINLIMDWSQLTFTYESKNTRIAEWNPSDNNIYAVLCHIMIGCFIHGEMTYQAMIGFICNDFPHIDQRDRIQTAAEVIAIAYQCGLIVITKNKDNMMITTEFELDEDLPDFDHHVPESFPYVAESNQILGCRFKQHDEDTCMSHINTMNAIPLALEWRVINHLKEQMEEKELEDFVNSKNPNKDYDLYKQFCKDFLFRSAKTYDNIADYKFYLKHHYDTRGRCYCEGYYVNYQGSSYKKAIIQLANKELI